MNFKEVALKAAKAASRIHLKYLNTNLKIMTKSSHQDRVTIADFESEKKIVSIIKKEFPDHNILAEEAKYEETKSDYKWIIDPLDGTNNFSHGYPVFCVSIALSFKKEVILGVVYNPLLKEMFVGEKGKGATLNGKKISVSPNSKLEDALLVTGFYYDRGQHMLRTLVEIKRFLLGKVNGIRRSGSAAFDLVCVACGRIDGFWEFYLSPWDFAAGMLIIREAGGKVTNRQGDKRDISKGYVVASNGKVHDPMLQVLNRR